jgi:uncharacterized protein
MKQRIKNLCAGGVLAVALFRGVAAAGPLEDGATAYSSGDYAAAMSYWRPLAERGNAAAEFGLGIMYFNGDGVPQDYAQARVWLRNAVDHDSAAEHTNLPGLTYAIAQFNLGRMYEGGQGGTQDYAEALIRFRKAAEYGFPYAQFSLGMMYENGQGTPQDYTQAHMWLNLAAATLTLQQAA